MKVYKPISDREVARRLGIRSIHTAYYYLQTIQEIYDAGLIICERLSTDEPQGEWKNEYHGNGWNDYWDYICSNCGKKYERADNVLYKSNYCPNCGVRMKGATNERV